MSLLDVLAATPAPAPSGSSGVPVWVPILALAVALASLTWNVLSAALASPRIRVAVVRYGFDSREEDAGVGQRDRFRFAVVNSGGSATHIVAIELLFQDSAIRASVGGRGWDGWLVLQQQDDLGEPHTIEGPELPARIEARGVLLWDVTVFRRYDDDHSYEPMAIAATQLRPPRRKGEELEEKRYIFDIGHLNKPRTADDE